MNNTKNLQLIEFFFSLTLLLDANPLFAMDLQGQEEKYKINCEQQEPAQDPPQEEQKVNNSIAAPFRKDREEPRISNNIKGFFTDQK